MAICREEVAWGFGELNGILPDGFLILCGLFNMKGRASGKDDNDFSLSGTV